MVPNCARSHYWERVLSYATSALTNDCRSMLESAQTVRDQNPMMKLVIWNKEEHGFVEHRYIDWTQRPQARYTMLFIFHKAPHERKPKFMHSERRPRWTDSHDVNCLRFLGSIRWWIGSNGRKARKDCHWLLNIGLQRDVRSMQRWVTLHTRIEALLGAYPSIGSRIRWNCIIVWLCLSIALCVSHSRGLLCSRRKDQDALEATFCGTSNPRCCRKMSPCFRPKSKWS